MAYRLSVGCSRKSRAESVSQCNDTSWHCDTDTDLLLREQLTGSLYNTVCHSHSCCCVGLLGTPLAVLLCTCMEQQILLQLPQADTASISSVCLLQGACKRHLEDREAVSASGSCGRICCSTHVHSNTALLKKVVRPEDPHRDFDSLFICVPPPPKHTPILFFFFWLPCFG